METWNDNTWTVTVCSSSENMLDSQNDMVELDEFCNYIMCDGDEELTLVDDSSSAQAAAADLVFPSNPFPSPAYQFRVGVDSPPRKKHRSSAPNIEEYQCPTSCISTESSPVNDADRPLQADGNNRWTMTLENGPLWQQFDRIGTEMVITKAGRYIHCV